MAKKIGSAKARKAVKEITKRVLERVKDLTPTEGAVVLGCGVDDVRNMRQGNGMSSTIFLKLVRSGRYSPKSIIEGPKLRKLTRGKSVFGAKQDAVDARVRKLAFEMPGKDLAKATGLSVTGAYGLRYGTGHVTLYTLLGLLDAGFKMDHLFFGKR